MFYGLRVNTSLATLGLKPVFTGEEYRAAMQRIGDQNRNSPQEVAVFIASQLPINLRSGLQPAVIKTWIREGKIEPASEEMQEALGALGFLDVRSGTAHEEEKLPIS